MTETSGEPGDGRWRIELLGGLRAHRGERTVTHFPTQKAGALLAYLAYYPDRAHRRDALIERLWPEVAAEDGRNSLRQTLFLLRQQLEPPGVPAGSVLAADRSSVWLNHETVTTDVADFGAACSAGLPSSGSAARRDGITTAGAAGSEAHSQWLARAVELYRGELLPGYFDDWVLQERQWLAERYFEALSQLLAHLERNSEFDRALRYARHGVSADPLREEAHRDLIRLLAAVGQPSAALRQYQELERLLKEQLDSTPEPATRALVREIERLAVLRQAPSAAARTPTPGAMPPVGSWIGDGENRLVTLLFADMSRSLETTRELHPEDAAALAGTRLRVRLLQAMVDVILKYEGRIDRFQGDGLLAVFGVPHAHEDDPERAIRAALEIREAAHHLALEVTAGINTAEVYVGEIGSERHHETTVMGPAVGLAARLQEQAQPGQILVSEVTQRLTRQAFEFSARTLGLKGLARPTTVYAVEQALPRPEKARGIEGLRAELIGRDEELKKLKAALTQALQGQGQIVTLIGEAGVGKSRLVAELKLAALAGVGGGELGVGEAPGASLSPTPNSPLPTPIRWLEGRCLELNMTAGYSAFVDLFRDHFAWRPEEDDRARGERLAACLRVLVEQGELSAERLDEMGPLLGNLVSLRFGTDWDLRLKYAGPEQIRHQTFLAVRDFLVALARRRPLILVLEDLHWADSLSLDMISLLMESLPLAPLLLLCVYRPEREHKCWHLGTIAARKCPGCFTELSLRELTPEQSRQLVESLLTIDNLPAAVRELILQKSRGNPFFVEEVVRSLIASGMVYRDGAPGTGPALRAPARGEGGTHAERGSGAWRAREEIETISVPESIQSVIASRVDRLRPELQQVLQSAAVIGRLFRPRLLERIVGSGQWGGTHEVGHGSEGQQSGSSLPELSTAHCPLPTALWELEEHDLIYQERVVPEEEYSFKHALTQETIYQSILRRQRPILHQQVGEAIEALYPGGLEEQYEQLAYHYERSGADEKAVEYLLKAGEKARRAHLNEAAIGYYQRALERLEGSTLCEARKEWRLEALRGLGLIHHGVGKELEAEGYLQQAVALGHEIGLASRELVYLYYWLGDALFWQQDKSEQLLRVGQAGLALVGEDTESVEAAMMNYLISVGHLQGHAHDKADDLIRRSEPILERLPYSDELRGAYYRILGMYSRVEDNVEAATRWLRIFEERARQHRDFRAVADGVSFRAGELLAERGDLRGAVSPFLQALELYGKIGGAKHQSICLNLLAKICLSLGRLTEAEEYADRSRETGEVTGEIWLVAPPLLQVGTALLCQDRPERASLLFQQAADLLRESGDSSREARQDHALARARLAQGQPLEAVKHFQEAAACAALQNEFLPLVLSGLEEAYAHPEEFRAFCQRFREEHPEVTALPLVQWYLEPTEPTTLPECWLHDPFDETVAPVWSWLDPFDDCGHGVGDGLEIRAANGRDLWGLNRSAPRLLRPVTGDFAVQTVCAAASKEMPAMGGLLLWKDKANYLRLDRGTRGEHEISFQGCLGSKDMIIGRGRLPAEPIFLRLERLGSRVSARCSADGQSWFTVGHAEFPVEDPLEVGLHAIGAIDRTLYHGAYPEGTAIHFESFDLWTNSE